MYGNPPVFKIDYPNKKNDLEREKYPYMCLIGEIESCLIPLICKIVHLIFFETVKKTHLEFAYDLLEASNRTFQNFTIEKDGPVKPIANFGLFYPKIIANPDRYILLQPELRKTLACLKRHKKELFLTSDHHYEYLQLMMTHTLGPDWLDFFDLVCVNTR
jgi:hypothetical protein